MDALRALREHLGALPEGVHVELDDGHLLVYRRLDMLHLDADALHDRLAHWTQTRLARELPAASATLSFRHASPADPHEASTLDLQEGWNDLEPTLALDLARAHDADVPRFAAHVPAFLALIQQNGRPAGYRRHDVGSIE